MSPYQSLLNQNKASRKVTNKNNSLYTVPFFPEEHTWDDQAIKNFDLKLLIFMQKSRILMSLSRKFRILLQSFKWSKTTITHVFSQVDRLIEPCFFPIFSKKISEIMIATAVMTHLNNRLVIEFTFKNSKI